MVKNSFYVVLCSFLLAGCCSVCPFKKDKSQTEYQYFREVALMPLSVEGDASLRTMVQDSVLMAVLMYTDRAVVGRGEIDEEYLKSLGFIHPESIGSLDLTEKPNGPKRLANIRKRFDPEVLIVGAFAVKDHVAHLNAQLVDARKVLVISSYSKEMEIKNDDVYSTVKSLAKDCILQMFGILKYEAHE